MIQFYSPDVKDTLTLGPEESGHCVRVLRKKAGDIIFVTDGKSRRYECVITDANPRGVNLEVVKSWHVAKGWEGEITLAVAPTKNADRMSWLVEKCTEMGVDRICFIKCDHSERKHLNAERLRRIAASAMNQSLKTRIPEISEMVSLDEIKDRPGKKYFGYCDAAEERKEFSKELMGSASDIITVVIGPEGDFSREEAERMKAAGFEAVTFGKERLRTETAALYGIAAIHAIENAKER